MNKKYFFFKTVFLRLDSRLSLVVTTVEETAGWFVAAAGLLTRFDIELERLELADELEDEEEEDDEDGRIWCWWLWWPIRPLLCVGFDCCCCWSFGAENSSSMSMSLSLFSSSSSCWMFWWSKCWVSSFIAVSSDEVDRDDEDEDDEYVYL